MDKEKTFIISKYLTVKLEDGKTVIYVADKPIRNCKFLLINILVDKISSFDEIQSIDEAAENLDRSLEPLRSRKQFKYSIPPDVEFWGHCSNLQVWYESGYNTKLLHSNLAFPLLRELTRVGDTQAKRVFKEEIAERYNNGIENVRKYLESLHFLDELSLEEFLSLNENEEDREVVERLRKEYPLFETPEIGGKVLRLNLAFKKGRVVKLNLNNIGLKKLPDYFKNLTSLEQLDISNNEIGEFPEWFGRLKSLRLLKAIRNPFKTLPKSIGELQSLIKLDLRLNQLESLPESIGNLKELRILNLEQNRIKILPNSMGGLSQLLELDLRENLLTSLPDSIGALGKLEKLNLRNNSIETLPETFGGLKNLEHLSFEGNKIKKLPVSMKDMQKLKVLNLSGTMIQTLPVYLYGLPKLERLYIKGLDKIIPRIRKIEFRNEYLTIFK